jgi:hypothetical protein
MFLRPALFAACLVVSAFATVPALAFGGFCGVGCHASGRDPMSVKTGALAGSRG